MAWLAFNTQTTLGNCSSAIDIGRVTGRKGEVSMAGREFTRVLLNYEWLSVAVVEKVVNDLV